MDIAASVLDLVGNTPMVYLDRVREPKGARVAAKLEMFNPGSSVKDRIGLPLIRAGEKAGLLKPGGTIVEPTSGNTGLGLAMAASILGYKMICTAADKITVEKVRLLEAFGAQVITCPTNVDADDPRSYYKVAERIRDEQGAYLPYQYYNQANPEAHLHSTGPEIWEQTDGKVTHLVVGMGTGGTISGTGRHLHQQAKKAKRSVQVVAVDTVGSVYKEFHRTGTFPRDIHQYLIDGIGEDFMPSTVWWEEIDHVATCTDEDAYLMQARLAREEAIFTGSSGGAAAHAAVQIAARLPKDALVVTLLPDTGERYLTKFNLAWMDSKGLTKAPAYLRQRTGIPFDVSKPAKAARPKPGQPSMPKAGTPPPPNPRLKTKPQMTQSSQKPPRSSASSAKSAVPSGTVSVGKAKKPTPRGGQ
ncbi:MAG TPA: pyridoxal-phosphate dependent enzyme [Candidatus Thermoplasmatota archaeon]|nr:pyridoxal-phosphate dependent enzyme [Candidatus Thermoplasmatota archaeon]